MTADALKKQCDRTVKRNDEMFERDLKARELNPPKPLSLMKKFSIYNNNVYTSYAPYQSPRFLKQWEGRGGW